MWNPALTKLALVTGGAIAGAIALRSLNKKKVFISFAVEDKKVRDFLVGQSRNRKTPFEFTDRSVKTPYKNAWKTQCRERIKDCHGVIVLVSENIYEADGVHWEVKCAKEEGLPIRAIYAYKDAKGCRVPDVLKGRHIYKWFY